MPGVLSARKKTEETAVFSSCHFGAAEMTSDFAAAKSY
jgi:hypothetical protein